MDLTFEHMARINFELLQRENETQRKLFRNFWSCIELVLNFLSQNGFFSKTMD